jgi:hypothetical protein
VTQVRHAALDIEDLAHRIASLLEHGPGHATLISR